MSDPLWTLDEFKCLWLDGIHCRIWINARPPYCDRGNWLAHIEPKPHVHAADFQLDTQDGWPRYYFDLERAKAECEAWMQKRREALPPT